MEEKHSSIFLKKFDTIDHTNRCIEYWQSNGWTTRLVGCSVLNAYEKARDPYNGQIISEETYVVEISGTKKMYDDLIKKENEEFD